MLDLGQWTRNREFHRYVDDGTLDLYARHSGSQSGIGRLCLLDDRVLAEIVRAADLSSRARVLDIGCGRGFLARWLRWYKVDTRYVGVDTVPEAVAAARRNAPQSEFVYAQLDSLGINESFDRVFALEPPSGGALSAEVAAAIGRHLEPGGRFVVTLISLDGAHEEKILRSIDLLQRHADVEQVCDLSLQVKEFASTMYSAFLLGAWDDAIKSQMCVKAAYVLHAIEGGTFNYTMLTGTRQEAA
ncbi:MAG TPA: methyltransferase domain-containing protein [Candidatus Baltobacteraceae bacterium]|jgi:SAM-dependent methyltransferase